MYMGFSCIWKDKEALYIKNLGVRGALEGKGGGAAWEVSVEILYVYAWEAVVLANRRIQGDRPKVPGRGCKRPLVEGAKGLWAQSGQITFAPVKCWVAPVQNKVWWCKSPF